MTDATDATTPITHQAAVLGAPIEHSLSPVLHTAGYRALDLDDWAYTRIECTAEDLPRIVGEADGTFVGFSVTMPGKFAALDFADEATERAREIGSANTLVRTDRGWRADNTDCDGVTGALTELFRGDLTGLRRALVLGGGGTARPALWALARTGVEEITVVNRTDRRADLAPLVEPHGVGFTMTDYDADLEALALAADVIVSTVPSAVLAGREEQLGHARVLDVIYDPWPTRLTVAAAANGHPSVGGHVMLAHQAYGQFEQFTGRKAPRQTMWHALEDALA